MLIGIILSVIALLVVLVLSTYRVIDPNEAHVITFMGFGRKLYTPRKTELSKAKTAYFYIPFLMKRIILPLNNVKMTVENIHLNDKEVAPFICDVIAWVNIDDPVIAAERLNLDSGDPFGSLKEDLINIVQSIARAVSMKQEILDILKDRATFSDSVSKEVEPALKKWGINLVNLEVNDIKDDETKSSRVIADYESIRKVQVNTSARMKTSQMDREAIEIEQENLRKAEIAKAESEKAYKTAQLEKDRIIGINEQNKDMSISKAQELANAQKISALKTLKVGEANVAKESTIQIATGESEAIRIKGEKEANVISLKGEAEGKAIAAKGIAEATSKEKMAEAMSKFNDASTNIEKIRAYIEINKAMYEAYGKIASNAEIKIVNSGQGASLLGMPLNAETGANLGQMLEGLDLSKIVDVIKAVKK